MSRRWRRHRLRPRRRLWLRRLYSCSQDRSPLRCWSLRAAVTTHRARNASSITKRRAMSSASRPRQTRAPTRSLTSSKRPQTPSTITETYEGFNADCSADSRRAARPAAARARTRVRRVRDREPSRTRTQSRCCQSTLLKAHLSTSETTSSAGTRGGQRALMNNGLHRLGNHQSRHQPPRPQDGNFGHARISLASDGHVRSNAQSLGQPSGGVCPWVV